VKVTWLSRGGGRAIARQPIGNRRPFLLDLRAVGRLNVIVTFQQEASMALLPTCLMNEFAAEKALKHVRKMVPLGADNRADNPLQAKAARALLDSRADLIVDAVIFNKGMTSGAVALAAKSYGAGNCGNQAAVALKFLEQMGIYPLDMMFDDRNDHNFVVIGRRAGSDPTDCRTWGPAAVVCDPWSNIFGRPNKEAVADMLDTYSHYDSQFRVTRPAHKSATKESPF
jgi:hypothetical protein